MLPLLREENPKYVQHYFGCFIFLSFLIPNSHTSLILFYFSYTWVEIHVCLQRIRTITYWKTRSTWVEIHVCLQHIMISFNDAVGSTWVEIHMCLQLECKMDSGHNRSTWVEIHVCLQRQ